jgi:methylenetetrahydrofolate dehydrogenase (NADP+)/methenyltetrahydrofolate cyclohydrolase
MGTKQITDKTANRTMETCILKTEPLQKHLLEQVKARVVEYTDKGMVPRFTIISVGDDAASEVYVRKKLEAAEACDIETHHISLPAETTQENLEGLIEALNEDEAVTAILLQLPLPKHLDGLKAVNKITPLKDVDGLTAMNTGLTAMKQMDALLPATPLGIMRLLKWAKIALKGKEATIVGQSHLVGRPLTGLLVQEGATVSTCHIDTEDTCAHLKDADVVISAVGQAHFITGDMLKEGAVAVDVGINHDKNGKLCGDIDTESCMGKLSAITPVPGGVGPMTVISIMTNILDAVALQNGAKRRKWANT